MQLSSIKLDWNIFWIENSSLIFAGLTAAATIILAYIGFKTWKESQRRKLEERRERAATLSPVAGFEVSNLPPYSDNNQLTELVVKNIGNCNMIRPKTLINYTWGGPARLDLKWAENEILAPNESKIFNIRLPDPPLELGEQKILIQCFCLHPMIGIILEWQREYPISYGR